MNSSRLRQPLEADKPVILVDMDGVLTDFEATVASRLASIYPALAGVAVGHNHDVTKNYPAQYEEAIRDIIYQPDFFSNMILADNALVDRERLLSYGFNPRICSSPLPDNERSVEAKKEWIHRVMVPVFGATVLNMAHITLDKYSVAGQVLIDDNPLLERGAASWTHVVFDKVYNEDVTGVPRLYGWCDPRMQRILGRVVGRSSSRY